jgi:hypothetical protein
MILPIADPATFPNGNQKITGKCLKKRKFDRPPEEGMGQALPFFHEQGKFPDGGDLSIGQIKEF